MAFKGPPGGTVIDAVMNELGVYEVPSEAQVLGELATRAEAVGQSALLDLPMNVALQIAMANPALRSLALLIRLYMLLDDLDRAMNKSARDPFGDGFARGNPVGFTRVCQTGPVAGIAGSEVRGWSCNRPYGIDPPPGIPGDGSTTVEILEIGEKPLVGFALVVGVSSRDGPAGTPIQFQPVDTKQIQDEEFAKFLLRRAARYPFSGAGPGGAYGALRAGGRHAYIGESNFSKALRVLMALYNLSRNISFSPANHPGHGPAPGEWPEDSPGNSPGDSPGAQQGAGPTVVGDTDGQVSVHPPDPDPPFPHPRDYERKMRQPAYYRGLGKLVGSATEFQDFINCAWDSIPKFKKGPDGKNKKLKYGPPLHEAPTYRYKGKDGKWKTGHPVNDRGQRITRPRPQDQYRDLYNHWDSVDLGDLAKCMLMQHYSDEMIGRIAGGANRAFIRHTGHRPFGLGVGPAL